MAAKIRKTMKIHPSEQASRYTSVIGLAMESMDKLVSQCRDPKRHQDDPVRLMVTVSVTIGNDRVVDVTRTVWDPPALLGDTEKIQ